MPSALKRWRQERRAAGYWEKARTRSSSMREPEIMAEVDVAVMSMGMTISRYRNNPTQREEQLDQLRELRLQLEACLGMLENVLPD